MRRLPAVVLMIATVIPAAACRREAARESAETPSATVAKSEYPAPRWPSYFQPPKSVDDLMPAARQLVRNKSGFLGVGMGVVQAGETILIVPTLDSDPMVVEAVTRALSERKITADVKYTYELLGQKKEDVLRQREAH